MRCGCHVPTAHKYAHARNNPTRIRILKDTDLELTVAVLALALVAELLSMNGRVENLLERLAQKQNNLALSNP